MQTDNFATWTVHARLQSYSGPLCLSVPHALTDGRRLVRAAVSQLIAFADDGELLKPRFSSIKPTIISREPRSALHTKFQNFLSDLLESDTFSRSENICLAVALDVESDPSFAGERNQVAFPVFQRNRLLELCKLPKEAWKSAVLIAARKEAADYSRLASQLRHMESASRLKFFARAPIQKADLVISYFGSLSRLLPPNQGGVLSSLDFAVTTSRGPAKIFVCYDDGDSIRGTLTESGIQQVMWESAGIQWGLENVN
jgi:hypothetical protein